MAIWSKVLGHDRIVIKEKKFKIGGDSARLIQVQKSLKRSLGKLVSSAKFFEYYAVEKLAVHLFITQDNAIPEHTAIQQERSNNNQEDIAIISMACWLPGNIGMPQYSGIWWCMFNAYTRPTYRAQPTTGHVSGWTLSSFCGRYSRYRLGRRFNCHMAQTPI